jgi:hypothetical protein
MATQNGASLIVIVLRPERKPMMDAPSEEGAADKVIAALKFLVFQCGSHGLPDYGQIIDDAAEQCLKLMLNKGVDSGSDVQRPH